VALAVQSDGDVLVGNYAGWLYLLDGATLAIKSQTYVGEKVNAIALQRVAPTTVSIVGTKDIADGVVVSIGSQAVSAAYTDFFYIESDNRERGIRVRKVGHTVAADQRKTVVGPLRTDETTGERYIDASAVFGTESGSVSPLGMNNQSITAAAGLKPVALLTRTWGSVKSTGPYSSYVIIDDGTGGIRVKVVLTGQVSPITKTLNVGNFVSITGTISLESGGVPVIIPRDDDDIKVL